MVSKEADKNNYQGKDAPYDVNKHWKKLETKLNTYIYIAPNRQAFENLQDIKSFFLRMNGIKDGLDDFLSNLKCMCPVHVQHDKDEIRKISTTSSVASPYFAPNQITHFESENLENQHRHDGDKLHPNSRTENLKSKVQVYIDRNNNNNVKQLQGDLTTNVETNIFSSDIHKRTSPTKPSPSGSAKSTRLLINTTRMDHSRGKKGRRKKAQVSLPVPLPIVKKPSNKTSCKTSCTGRKQIMNEKIVASVEARFSKLELKNLRAYTVRNDKARSTACHITYNAIDFNKYPTRKSFSTACRKVLRRTSVEHWTCGLVAGEDGNSAYHMAVKVTLRAQWKRFFNVFEKIFNRDILIACHENYIASYIHITHLDVDCIESDIPYNLSNLTPTLRTRQSWSQRKLNCKYGTTQNTFVNHYETTLDVGANTFLDSLNIEQAKKEFSFITPPETPIEGLNAPLLKYDAATEIKSDFLRSLNLMRTDLIKRKRLTCPNADHLPIMYLEDETTTRPSFSLVAHPGKCDQTPAVDGDAVVEEILRAAQDSMSTSLSNLSADKLSIALSDHMFENKRKEISQPTGTNTTTANQITKLEKDGELVKVGSFVDESVESFDTIEKILVENVNINAKRICKDYQAAEVNLNGFNTKPDDFNKNEESFSTTSSLKSDNNSISRHIADNVACTGLLADGTDKNCQVEPLTENFNSLLNKTTETNDILQICLSIVEKAVDENKSIGVNKELVLTFKDHETNLHDFNDTSHDIHENNDQGIDRISELSIATTMYMTMSSAGLEEEVVQVLSDIIKRVTRLVDDPTQMMNQQRTTKVHSLVVTNQDDNYLAHDNYLADDNYPAHDNYVSDGSSSRHIKGDDCMRDVNKFFESLVNEKPKDLPKLEQAQMSSHWIADWPFDLAMNRSKSTAYSSSFIPNLTEDGSSSDDIFTAVRPCFHRRIHCKYVRVPRRVDFVSHDKVNNLGTNRRKNGLIFREKCDKTEKLLRNKICDPPSRKSKESNPVHEPHTRREPKIKIESTNDKRKRKLSLPDSFSTKYRKAESTGVGSDKIRKSFCVCVENRKQETALSREDSVFHTSLARQTFDSKKRRVSPYFSAKQHFIDKKPPGWKSNIQSGCRGAHETIDYAPPKSPYNLIQEQLYKKPWQLLVATIFLNRTTGQAAIPVFWQFIKKYPTPQRVIQAKWEDIAELMTPLGLHEKRSKNIIRLSNEYLHKDWKYPIELYGIGNYGDDSYRIFCLGQWRQVKPNDHKLNLYHEWISQQDRMGLLPP